MTALLRRDGLPNGRIRNDKPKLLSSTHTIHLVQSPFHPSDLAPPSQSPTLQCSFSSAVPVNSLTCTEQRSVSKTVAAPTTRIIYPRRTLHFTKFSKSVNNANVVCSDEPPVYLIVYGLCRLGESKCTPPVDDVGFGCSDGFVYESLITACLEFT